MKAFFYPPLPPFGDVFKKTMIIFKALITVPITERREGLVWGLLLSIEREVHLRRLLLRCLLFQYNEKILPAELPELLEAKTGDEHNASAAWMMLAELSAVIPVDPSIAEQAWLKVDTDSESNVTSYVAKILANRVSDLNGAQRRNLKEDMIKKLMEFR